MHLAPSGTPDATGLRIGVAVSDYHRDVTDALREGAVAAFQEAGGAAHDLELLVVPGAFELTAAAHHLARAGHHDAIVALGCIVTGETTHDRYIASAVAHGLTMITVQTGVPVTFGVLTCQSLEQAKARAGGDHGNKGREAMSAAIRVARVCRGELVEDGR